MMIRPTKHAHPDKTVVAVAVVLLAKLRRQRLAEFDELRTYLRKNRKGTDALFLPALNLLFLLGLVEYRLKTDAFEYVGA